MGHVRARLAQIEELTGFAPSVLVGAALVAVTGTSAASYLGGIAALAVALAAVAIVIAAAAWRKLARLHHEHRALLEVVTDLAAVAVRAPKASSAPQAADAATAEPVPAQPVPAEPPAPAAPSEPVAAVADEATVTSTEPVPTEPRETLADLTAPTHPTADAFEQPVAGADEASSDADEAGQGPAVPEVAAEDVDPDSVHDEHLPRLAELLPWSPVQALLRDGLGLPGTDGTPTHDAAPSSLFAQLAAADTTEPAVAMNAEALRLPDERPEREHRPTEHVTLPSWFTQSGSAVDRPAHPVAPVSAETGEPTTERQAPASSSAAAEAEATKPADTNEAEAANGPSIPTPAFTLPTLDGRTVDQTVFGGRPTVLVFWRPGCPHSEGLTPELIALQSELTADGPRMVIVAACEAAAVERLGFTATVLLDPTFSVGQAMGVGGTPAAVLLGPNGKPFGQIAAGASAVLGMVRAACRAWAALTTEQVATATEMAAEPTAEATDPTTKRLDLGPNPFERLAAETTRFRPVIIRRRTSPTPLLEELDAEWDEEQTAHRQAG